MTERERRRKVVDYLRAGNAEGAADELAASREAYPGDGLLHHAIGLAFASRGTLGRAREQLEAAAELGPESGEILADLAQVRLAQGEAQPAIEAAEQALALHPDLALARFTLGRACLVVECARQARRAPQAPPGHDFPVIDGRTPLYLRAMREMEAALELAPPFTSAVRAALAFAYIRAGHYHAAAAQLNAELSELPPGREADRVRTRLLHAECDVARERYWAIERSDLPAIRRAARASDAAPERRLRLAHAYAALGREDKLSQTLAEARDAGYRPRAARVSRLTGDVRLYRELSDVHLLIAGGLECVLEDQLRFIPFASLEHIALGEQGVWREAELRLASGEAAAAAVPTLYRLSVQSPSELIQSGRFTQFSYPPGETRYASALGTRNLTTEDGLIPLTEVTAIEFL